MYTVFYMDSVIILSDLHNLSKMTVQAIRRGHSKYNLPSLTETFTANHRIYSSLLFESPHKMFIALQTTAVVTLKRCGPNKSSWFLMYRNLSCKFTMLFSLFKCCINQNCKDCCRPFFAIIFQCLYHLSPFILEN